MARDDLAVRRDLIIPAREIVESASRSGGPGGQHVNKANTRVTLHWNVRESEALSPAQRARLLARTRDKLTRSGELVVHAGGSRSRSQNREAARARLAEIVNHALRRTRRRIPTRPGASAVDRRIAEKKQRSRRKQNRQRPQRDD